MIAVGSWSCFSGTHRAQELVDQAIAAHGGSNFEEALVTFDFRDRSYAVRRTSGRYSYTRTFRDTARTIQDVLINSSDFVRIIDGDTSYVADSMALKYRNSVNSVLYFVQLPYLLNDPAAIKAYQGLQEVEGQPYDVVKVTFRQSGGGKDFEDEYRYWIHAREHTVDYLAYTYSVDGGGTRFRQAYNRSWHGGILFQDYINYEVPVHLPLREIPSAFERGALKELSRIENTNIRVKQL